MRKQEKYRGGWGSVRRKGEEQRKEEEKGSKGQKRKEAQKDRGVRPGGRQAGRKTQEATEPSPSP